MFSDHLKTCEYCRNEYYSKVSKPTIRIKSASSYGKQKKPTITVKSASSYHKHKKLSELAAIINGISYPSLESIPLFRTKGASKVVRNPGPIEREVKLRELGKLVRG
jgi:hypothetical protein